MIEETHLVLLSKTAHSLLYGGEFTCKSKGHTQPEPKLVVFTTCLCIPGRPRSRARFRAKARLLWGTLSEKTNKHEKTAAKFNT